MLLSLIVWCASASQARATFTQAQIGSFQNDGTSSFNWTLNGAGNQGTLSGTSGGYFTFTNIPGAPSGPIAATMTVTETTTLNGSITNSNLNQPLNGPLTIDIVQNGTGAHLLTTTVAGGPPVPLFSGVDHSGAVAASQPTNNVLFTSDLSAVTTALGGAQGSALTVSLAAIQPGLSFNPSFFLNNFTAAGSATFSSSTAVPEPASVALLGLGCVALVGARLRFGRKLA